MRIASEMIYLLFPLFRFLFGGEDVLQGSTKCDIGRKIENRQI